MRDKTLKYDPLNIVICGIGGQGNILASELLGSVFVDLGYKVAIGETYGASQRGGSVMSHVRISKDKELSVLIPKGKAHVIVGFEPLETLRMLREYGSKETTVIYDLRVAYPLGVLSGEAVYPDPAAIKAEIASRSKKAYVVPAAGIALDEGNAKAANIALMGALTGIPEMPLDQADYAKALAQRFEGPARQLNERVFARGYEALLSAGDAPAVSAAGSVQDSTKDENTQAALITCLFRHPFEDRTMTLTLPETMTFRQLTKRLYAENFMPKKKADYKYIVNGHLCSLGASIGSYAGGAGRMEIMVHGLLTVLA